MTQMQHFPSFSIPMSMRSQTDERVNPLVLLWYEHVLYCFCTFNSIITYMPLAPFWPKMVTLLKPLPPSANNRVAILY